MAALNLGAFCCLSALSLQTQNITNINQRAVYRNALSGMSGEKRVGEAKNLAPACVTRLPSYQASSKISSTLNLMKSDENTGIDSYEFMSNSEENKPLSTRDISIHSPSHTESSFCNENETSKRNLPFAAYSRPSKTSMLINRMRYELAITGSHGDVDFEQSTNIKGGDLQIFSIDGVADLRETKKSTRRTKVLSCKTHASSLDQTLGSGASRESGDNENCREWTRVDKLADFNQGAPHRSTCFCRCNFIDSNSGIDFNGKKRNISCQKQRPTPSLADNPNSQLGSSLLHIDKGLAGDPLFVTGYVLDLYRYFHAQEELDAVCPLCLEDRATIDPTLRSILVDWIVDVHFRWKLTPQTLFLAVNIIDRYFRCEQAMKDEVRLVAGTAFWIASKYEDVNPPFSRDIIELCNHDYSQAEVRKEKNYLRFTSIGSTSNNF